jgi:hypothetical protein
MYSINSKFYQKVTYAKKYTMKNMFLLNFAMLLNKPATAHVKIRGHLTVFLPTDGNTCFDGMHCNRGIVEVRV